MIAAKRASVCKTTRNHPASQIKRREQIGLYTVHRCVQNRSAGSLYVGRGRHGALAPSCTVLADYQRLGWLACIEAWSTRDAVSALRTFLQGTAAEPARAQACQRAAGSSEAPPWTPARRPAAAGGLEPNRDTLDAHRDAANGSGHTRDAHRPPPAGSEWNRRGRLRFVNHGQGPKQGARPRDARLHD